jgi:hypothetical protein
MSSTTPRFPFTSSPLLLALAPAGRYHHYDWNHGFINDSQCIMTSEYQIPPAKRQNTDSLKDYDYSERTVEWVGRLSQPPLHSSQENLESPLSIKFEFPVSWTSDESVSRSELQPEFDSDQLLELNLLKLLPKLLNTTEPHVGKASVSHVRVAGSNYPCSLFHGWKPPCL